MNGPINLYLYWILIVKRNAQLYIFTEKKNIRGIMSGLYRNVPYDLTDAEKDMAYQIALKQWAYCVENSGINAWIEQVPPIDH